MRSKIVIIAVAIALLVAGTAVAQTATPITVLLQTGQEIVVGCASDADAMQVTQAPDIPFAYFTCVTNTPTPTPTHDGSKRHSRNLKIEPEPSLSTVYVPLAGE